MTYKPNLLKEELIGLHGAGYGTPLFSQQKELPAAHKLLPDWICDASGIKAEIYNKMKNKFAEDSLEYLNAVLNLGGSATDHDVKSYFDNEDKWPLHIVSARRNYFKNDPFYIIVTYPDKNNPGKPVSKPGPQGKPNTVWYVDFKRLFTLLLD
jgi:hypothetical protein